MTRQNAAIIAQAMSVVGVLVFMAMAFDLLADNLAIFVGAACFVIAGFVWSIRGRLE